MRYYKQIENNYITAIGTGGGGIEITPQEYNQIISVIQNKPERTANVDYHLKTDLTWEEYERIEPIPETEENPDPSEIEQALNILLGYEGR